MDHKRIYDNLPVWAQNIACDWTGWNLGKSRYGKYFRRMLAEYESHDGWTYEQMCDYRDKRIRKMVEHCYRTVPYYRRLFDAGGINPERIRHIDDLSVVPVLTKSEIVSHPQDFISSDYRDRKLSEISTSGSTGSSLILRVTPENIEEQNAIWWRYRHRLGISEDLWQANFGSKVIVPQKQEGGPYWRVCHPLRQVMFSTFHGSSDTYGSFYEEICRRKLSWLHGYPSCLVPFANYMIENGLHFGHEIKFVTVGAENIYDYQKHILTEAFGCRPHSHYGLTEAVANFSENSDGLQEVDEDFAAVEFLQEGELYRIVGTNLFNFSMPLVRYDTSDMAFINGRIGGQGRIVDFVDGRSGDLIRFPDGRQIGAFSALFSETTRIDEAQIYQKADYSIEIRFVTHYEDWMEDIRTVEKMFRERIGNDLPVRFVRVPKLERALNGKLRYVLSEIN